MKIKILGGLVAAGLAITLVLALLAGRDPDLAAVRGAAEQFVERYNQGKNQEIYLSCGSEIWSSIPFEQLDQHLQGMKAASGAIQLDREIATKLESFRYDHFATAAYSYYGGKSSGEVRLNFRWDGTWRLIKFDVKPR